MNRNSNLMTRLMIAELPGLVGAMQAASPGGQGRGRVLSDLALQQHRRNLGNAMLLAASRLLAPASKGNPAGSLQRLGAGLGAWQGSGQGAGGPGILDVLATGRGQLGTAGSAVNRGPAQRTTGPASTPETEAADPSSRGAAVARQNAAGRPTGGTQPKPARRATLHKFSGTVARRLEYPAVLAGGWQLYGYDKKSGGPVYVGPNRELRLYA
jgi:hypothetical protein